MGPACRTSVALLLSASFTLLGYVAPRPTSAAVVPFNFAALTERSKFILTGEVVALRSYRAPFHDAGEVIYTDVTIRIEKVFKGAPEGAEITIQILGGEIGERWQKCLESARYERGEKVLVFVRDYNNAVWNTGWFQGKYRLDATGSQVLGVEHSPIPFNTSLTQVEAAIRTVPKETGSIAPGAEPRSLEPASRETPGKGGSK